MVAVSDDLITHKYDLVKDSGRRYEILHVARCDVMFEISKLAYNTEYFQGVPELYQSSRHLCPLKLIPLAKALPRLSACTLCSNVASYLQL